MPQRFNAAQQLSSEDVAIAVIQSAREKNLEVLR
jgi:hypothetical protein